MSLLSVIVPVYNTEKYLERCLNSILNQSVKDLEIILVNDGSTDNSLKICEKYKEKYSNIILINQKNQGLSAARNQGIEKSNGDYLAFIDSDDWIDENIYNFAMNEIVENDADVFDFECEKTKVYKTTRIDFVKENVTIIENEKILEEYLRKGLNSPNCPFSACRKIYKRDIINNIRFPEGKVNEDIITNFEILKNAKKMIVTSQTGYYYYQSENSISRNGLRAKDFDIIDVCDEMYKQSREYGGKIEYYAKIKRERCEFSLLSKIAYYGIEDKSMDISNTIRNLKKELSKNKKSLLKSPIPKSRKILIVCFCINFRLTKMMLRIMKKIRRR